MRRHCYSPAQNSAAARRTSSGGDQRPHHGQQRLHKRLAVLLLLYCWHRRRLVPCRGSSISITREAAGKKGSGQRQDILGPMLDLFKHVEPSEHPHTCQGGHCPVDEQRQQPALAACDGPHHSGMTLAVQQLHRQRPQCQRLQLARNLTALTPQQRHELQAGRQK